jgi:diguanylate cyclase (GGDEF)-like protein/PAS domain S-box-containing protein
MAAASNGIVIADATREDCPIIYINAGFERLSGYSYEDILGRNCRFLQGPDTDPVSVRELGEAVRSGAERRVTLLNYRKDGKPFWNELFLAPVHDADGRLVQYVGVQNDVTERRRAEEQVAHMAYHDALTGLANRAKLEASLSRALRDANQRKLSLALLYLDLDDFKSVNDRLGHAAGDDLLREAARRLHAVCRPSDILARQGGDEFLILLDALEEEPEKTAAAVAERAARALSEPFDLGGHKVTVGASVGLSLFPRDARDADSLLKHADSAMYAAKSNGRGRVSLYVDDHPTGERRTGVVPPPVPETVEAIVQASAIRTVFQPIVELANGAVVGYEALSRGPEGSALERPDLLFEAARRGGLLEPLDWACRTTAMRTALEAGLSSPLSLFVNVEPDALGLAPPAQVAEVWERATDRDNVFLEITERALTDRPAELMQAVDKVRELGWGVALDDVGADVRSLALMPLLSPDIVKLDLRLIQQQPSLEIAEIVNAVSAYRERTGARVVAEGVETEEHLQTAYAMGATLGQGWLFGRPGPLPAQLPWNREPIPTRPMEPPRPGDSPFQVVRAAIATQRMTKPLLLAISRHLEQQAITVGSGAVILSAFQGVERFTPVTKERYESLARRAAFVGALGVGMDSAPAEGACAEPSCRSTTCCSASGAWWSSARTSAERSWPRTWATRGPTMSAGSTSRSPTTATSSWPPRSH